MKRIVVRILGASALVALITLNVTSTMEFTPGGEEVKAFMSGIPCWSAYGPAERGHKFVYCLICDEKGGEPKNTTGSCSPDTGGASIPTESID